MKVNGTRVEDLAGTGLLTKQRIVVPIWATLTWRLIRWIAGVAWALAVVIGRRWRVTAPVAVVGTVWVRYGQWWAVALVVAVVLALLAWRVLFPTSFDVRITRVVRGWWRWQVRYRRHWQAAMDGTGLTRTTPDRKVFVPLVLSVRSTRIVDVLELRLLYGHTPGEVTAQAEALRHTFEAHRCVVHETKPGHVEVRFFRTDSLRDTIPAFTPPVDPDLAGLPVGVREDGEVYRIALTGRHLLVAGSTGSGKGSVVWSIVTALADGVRTGTVVLTGIDPKGGMELYPGRALFTHYADESPEAMVTVLEDRVAAMNIRKDWLRATGQRGYTPSSETPLEVIVIDEAAFLTAYLPDKNLRKRVNDALQTLLSQGRGPGFAVVVVVQDPRADVLPFRALFPHRIALRLAEDSHVDMVLSDGALARGARCHEISDTTPGIAFARVEDTVEPIRVRFTYPTDTHITGLAATYYPGAPDPRTVPAAVPAVVDLTDRQLDGQPVPVS